METDANYTLIGGFVILMTMAIVLAIIWFSSGFSQGHYAVYEVDMQEAVSGLSVGAAVEFNGVNVGRVNRISISEHNPRLVILLLAVRDNTPVTEGTRATITLRGLTGISYISLQDNGTQLIPLQAHKDHLYPIIPAVPSFFLQLDKTIANLSEQVTQLSQSLTSLLNKENLKLFHDTLQHINALADQQLPVLLESSTQTVRALDMQTLPKVNQTLAQLQQASRNVSILSNALQHNPAMLVRGRVPLAKGPGE